MGYSRAGSLSLNRDFNPWTLSGFASAGSTCWPSSGLLCNRSGSAPSNSCSFTCSIQLLKLRQSLVGNLILS